MSNADTPTAGRLEKGEHLLPVRIYYEDTDFTGVVYHANYLRYCERGRSDYLRVAGISHTDLASGDQPSAFTVTRIELDYKKPARVDDALLVRTRVAALKGPRIIFGQTIERGEDILCEALVTAVSIHMDGRPRRPSPEEVTIWKALMEEKA